MQRTLLTGVARWVGRSPLTHPSFATGNSEKPGSQNPYGFFAGAGIDIGTSEVAMSATAFHEPSACLLYVVT